MSTSVPGPPCRWGGGATDSEVSTALGNRARLREAGHPGAEGSAAGRRALRAAQTGMLRTGGLTTLPDRMHDVQALMRRGEPSIRARTRWMLGSHRRFVLRWE